MVTRTYTCFPKCCNTSGTAGMSSLCAGGSPAKSHKSTMPRWYSGSCFILIPVSQTPSEWRRADRGSGLSAGAPTCAFKEMPEELRRSRVEAELPVERRIQVLRKFGTHNSLQGV